MQTVTGYTINRITYVYHIGAQSVWISVHFINMPVLLHLLSQTCHRRYPLFVLGYPDKAAHLSQTCHRRYHLFVLGYPDKAAHLSQACHRRYPLFVLGYPDKAAHLKIMTCYLLSLHILYILLFKIIRSLLPPNNLPINRNISWEMSPNIKDH